MTRFVHRLIRKGLTVVPPYADRRQFLWRSESKSQVPPAKPEACRCGPLKAASSVCWLPGLMIEHPVVHYNNPPDGTCSPIVHRMNFEYSSIRRLSFLWTLSGSQEESFRILPELSNSVSPPEKPGVYQMKLFGTSLHG